MDQGLGAVSGSIKENHAKCRVKPGYQTQGVILHLRHKHNLIFIYVLMSDMSFPLEMHFNGKIVICNMYP